VHTLALVNYEWDPQKAAANFKKHKVDFADAVGVFQDPLALTVSDDRHEEARFVTMGTDFLGRLLVVAYTRRAESLRIQRVSAVSMRDDAYGTGIRFQ
jgi:uncharacterized protein